MALVGVPKASHSPPEFTYDVFLSFRGADTRKGFTDYLYLSLRHAGIETFRDDDEIERGEGIKPELRKAIEQSKMSIIVFSKDYASSRACLYEVEMILRRSKSFDHGILPVFYDVDPSDLKNSASALAVEAEELERHESRSERAERMKEWSAALKEIASVAGMVLMNQADRAGDARMGMAPAPKTVGQRWRVGDSGRRPEVAGKFSGQTATGGSRRR